VPPTSNLFAYANELTGEANKQFASGEVFAKVLTPNDDSGRHGVLIPSDAYPYFPEFLIPDPTVNATGEFLAFDTISRVWKTLGYKYYERYPERRITRLNGILNNLDKSPRILVFLHAKHTDGSSGYYVDCANSATSGRFQGLFRLVFGEQIDPIPGNFVVRPVDSAAFAADPILTELLGKFDDIRNRGWIDALRSGHTGIGYTFETLVGIEENNDQIADFNGIEIKCQGMKEGDVASSGKINLFQKGPVWVDSHTARERIRLLGKIGANGLYACHSQVTTSPNNIGLLLEVLVANSQIDIRKNSAAVGYWSFDQLAKRLAEKHARAAFVKAKTRKTTSKTQFSYEELIYCERPSIKRFVDLVVNRNIVFEFLMSEKKNGSIRNHGYPWRLCRAALLDQLFAFQIKLR
jgi:hypothetical protein